MKILTVFLIFGILYSSRAEQRKITSTEAVVPPGCADCNENKEQKPLGNQPVKAVAQHVNQCESEKAGGIIPPGVEWALQPCDKLSKIRMDYVKRCLPGEPVDINGTLLSILAVDIFDREYQLMMRGTPLDPADDKGMNNFLAKWEYRKGQIPDYFRRQQIDDAIKATREQWAAAKKDDEENTGPLKLDMAVARAAVSYQLIKNVSGPAFLKSLQAKGLGEQQAKDMQTEELDALYFEYPEFLGMRQDNSFEMLVPELFDPRKIDQKIQNSCHDKIGASRMERIACRKESASADILPKLDEEAAHKNFFGQAGNMIKWAKRDLTLETIKLIGTLDSEWNKSVKDPARLKDQPELWMQLSAQRSLKGDVDGEVRATVLRCETQAALDKTLAKEAKIEKWTGHVTMGLAIGAMFLKGGEFVAARATVMMNSSRLAGLAGGLEKASMVTGVLAASAFALNTTHRLISTQLAYRREMTTFMIANTRTRETTSNEYKNLQGAITNRSSAWTDTAVVAMAMAPMAMSMVKQYRAQAAVGEAAAAEYGANLAREAGAKGFESYMRIQAASSGSKAKILATHSSRYCKLDIVADAAWLGYSLYNGNAAGASIQALASSTRFGRGANQVKRVTLVGHTPQGASRPIGQFSFYIYDIPKGLCDALAK